MSGRGTKFTTAFELEAAQSVIDSGDSIAEAAKDLNTGMQSLQFGFAGERRRIETAEVTEFGQPRAAQRSKLADWQLGYNTTRRNPSLEYKASPNTLHLYQLDRLPIQGVRSAGPKTGIRLTGSPSGGQVKLSRRVSRLANILVVQETSIGRNGISVNGHN